MDIGGDDTAGRGANRQAHDLRGRGKRVDRRERRLHHCRLAGVDRDRQIQPTSAQGSDHRGCAGDFFGHLDLGGGLGIQYTDEVPPAADALIAAGVQPE